MDKSEAIKRLDALENEAAKLREIIEASDKIIYDGHKIYVAIQDRCPYILVGVNKNQDFAWHCFETHTISWGTEGEWSSSTKTGQYAIDSMINDGGYIFVFSDGVEAIQFFYDEYMKAHK